MSKEQDLRTLEEISELQNELERIQASVKRNKLADEFTDMLGELNDVIRKYKGKLDSFKYENGKRI